MDDVVFLAHLQSTAQVNTQLDDLPPCERLICFLEDGDGGQQLHSDEHIPAHPVLVGLDVVVLVAHDVAVAFQAAHQSDFPVQALRIIAEIDRCAVPIHAVGQQVFQIVLRRRHRDGLECSSIHCPESIFPFDLEHLAVASLADETLDVP